MRKLGITHMAYYRGWLQGLPLRDMADAYLETGLDLRLAKATLAWVQDTLRQAALRQGRHGDARLLRVRLSDVHEVTGQAAALPSIDDFREEVDPTSFFSHDELMALYLERFPNAGNARAQRRAALLERQLRALTWLETLLVTEPSPADPVAAWFDPGIAQRLENGGIATLAELIQRITDGGYRWYNTVPQMGEVRAKRLLHWLGSYRASLGALPAHALVEPKALTARPAIVLDGLAADPDHPSIVPLEAMLLPLRAVAPEVAGAATPQIPATNDREAIETWLNAQSGSMATRRAYRKEAERLVLWATLERGRTLPQLTVDDCTAYRDWLCGLGRVEPGAWPFRIPQDQWFAPRHIKRYSPAWRPFEGVLSAKSVLQAITICTAMMRWLHEADYLPHFPWRLVAKPRPVGGDAPDLELTRALTPEQWSEVVMTVGRIEDITSRRRGLLALRLAVVTGLRLSELAGARYGHLYAKARRGGGERWMLRVLGKGAQWRPVPVPPDILALMLEDLQANGLPRDARNAPADTPILTRLDGGAITASGLAKMFKGSFALTATALRESGRPMEAAAIARASTHWIRHTTGALLGDAGTPVTQIQQLLGHASVATTSIYTSTSEDVLYDTVVGTLGVPGQGPVTPNKTTT